MERIKFLEESCDSLIDQKIYWTNSVTENSKLQDQWHEEERELRQQLSEAKNKPVDKLVKPIDELIKAV